MPFWQFFRKGWDGRALLVRPSKMHHRIGKILFVLSADEYLERLEGKIRMCLFFYVKITVCVIWRKKQFFQFFHRNDKTSEGRWFKLWKKNIWIPLFKASFCSLPPLWPTFQFKTRHGDLDQTSWHPWHTCSTCQCWTNWQVRILKIRLWAIL